MAAAAAADPEHGVRSVYLQKFRLYETRLKFYMIGRDKSRTVWRVLKIDRTEPSELNICEDHTNYSESECYDLLRRIHEGNRSNGGLKFVTNCYGIAGFVKFLGPYYMLLITQRRKIGTICGHTVYGVSKSKMIALPNSTMRPNMAYSKDENRYKKLLCTVDLTKDFFFSYSYQIMCSLQRNLCEGQTGQVLYEAMFVWNEYLTRGIRNHLKNTMWTVALVYGFFKQANLTVAGKEFSLTLIARRSRHFAGTRYLKRGVNDKGRVANDVETEQIVFEDNDGGIPSQISSVVQHRGSIPLFWSQESSWLNMKPDIILHKNQNYEATQLHFDNLVKRYGNPIIVLNLIKTREKKPRETILRAEYAKAIDHINKSLPEDSRLRFLHWDLHKYSRRKSTDVLALLGKVMDYALNLTGFFYCQVQPALRHQGALTRPILLKGNAGQWSSNNYYSGTHDAVGSHKDTVERSDFSFSGSPEDKTENVGFFLTKSPMLQKGVLRTNCIDCLDRTNVAQYAYGLTAVGHQLYALDFIDVPKIDLESPLADDLMCFYERMGDTLAFQYGGSAAHNKIFSERRGQWKAATHSQEFLRTLQRYYSNTYMDAEKQDAINVFLGHFQPQLGKPALWELDSDQHYNIGRRGHTLANENSRSFIKRSMSDGHILCENSTPVSNCSIGEGASPNSVLHATIHQKGDVQGLSDSTPEISTCENEISYSRCTPVMSRRHFLTDGELNYFNEFKLDASNCSNFLDFDWISSSGNSCEEENYERSSLINSLVETLSTENVINCMTSETARDPSENSIEASEAAGSELSYSAARTSDANMFSKSFIDWVVNGEAFSY